MSGFDPLLPDWAAVQSYAVRQPSGEADSDLIADTGSADRILVRQ